MEFSIYLNRRVFVTVVYLLVVPRRGGSNYHYFIKDRTVIHILFSFVSYHCAIFNPQWLELSMSRLIVLGFNDTSTLVGHFVSSLREREKRDRRDSRRDEREEQGRKRHRNESEKKNRRNKTIPPSTLSCYKDSRPCPTVSQYQLGAPVT